MAQSATPDDEARERVSATELSEGDRVFMGINLHGSSDGLPGVEYDRDNYQSGVEGTVTKALSDTDKELLDDWPTSRSRRTTASSTTGTWTTATSSARTSTTKARVGPTWAKSAGSTSKPTRRLGDLGNP